MNYKVILLVLALLVSILGMGTVSAAEYNITQGSIQNAIDNANPGDTINVNTGTYTGAINVNKTDLSLIAVGNVIINCTGLSYGFKVTESFNTIDGFQIENATNKGIWITANNTTLKNNKILNTVSSEGEQPAFGILVEGNNTLIDNNMVNNTFTPEPSGIPEAQYDSSAILVNGDMQTIINNIITNSCNCGISSNGELINITGNIIRNIQGNYGGIAVSSSSTTIIIDKNILDNTRYFGIFVYNEDGATFITNNIISNVEAVTIQSAFISSQTLNGPVNILNNKLSEITGIKGIKIISIKSPVNIIGNTIYNTIQQLDSGLGISTFNDPTYTGEGELTIANNLLYNIARTIEIGINSPYNGFVSIDNNMIHDVGFGIVIVGNTKKVNITNNTIYNSYFGIKSTDDDNVLEITNNNIYNAGHDEVYGIEILGNAEIHFNRIICNSGVRNDGDGTVNANYNWWGTNQPDFSKLIDGNVKTDHWMVLSIHSNPSTVYVDDTSQITADLLYDNTGNYHNPLQGFVPYDGLAGFTTTKGFLLDTNFINGKAQSTLNGLNSPGTAHVSAHVDNQVVTTNVTIPEAVTINQLMVAAGQIKAYAESHNYRLPATLNVAGQTLTMAQLLKLFTKATINFNIPDLDPIPVTEVGNAPNPQGYSPTGDLYKSEYLNVAKNIQNFINTNKRAPNYASTSLGNIPFTRLVYIYSKVINFYGYNNRLPNYLNTYKISTPGTIKPSPTVVSTTPSNNGTYSGLTKPVYINYDYQLFYSSGTITIKNLTTKSTLSTPSFYTNWDQLIIQFADSRVNNNKYQITIPAGMYTNLYGNYNSEYTLTFTAKT